MKWLTILVLFFALVLIASAADEKKASELKPSSGEIQHKETVKPKKV
jgi:hypothetical protein